MKLLCLQYQHPATGIIFEIEFKEGKKYITVQTRHGDDEFMFKNSKPETLIKIGEALLSIGNFCATMEIENPRVWKAYYNLE